VIGAWMTSDLKHSVAKTADNEAVGHKLAEQVAVLADRLARADETKSRRRRWPDRRKAECHFAGRRRFLVKPAGEALSALLPTPLEIVRQKATRPASYRNSRWPGSGLAPNATDVAKAPDAAMARVAVRSAQADAFTSASGQGRRLLLQRPPRGHFLPWSGPTPAMQSRPLGVTITCLTFKRLHLVFRFSITRY
jgi:hypothetical protein